MTSAAGELTDRIKAGNDRENKIEIALKELEKIYRDDDPEEGHWLADVVLMEILKLYNRQNIVDAWMKLDKWYS